MAISREQQIAELSEQLEALLTKLKKSADEFEPVTLEPGEAMLAWRCIKRE